MKPLVVLVALGVSVIALSQTGVPSYVISTVAGTDSVGDGGPAEYAVFWSISGLALDAAGNLYITDATANRIRKVTCAGGECRKGVSSTIAGNGLGYFSGEGEPATSAQLSTPQNVTFDRGGNLYIAEYARIRRISPDGVITTIAGTGEPGYSGDGGPARRAKLSSNTWGLATDPAGNVFFSDLNRIRRVTPGGVMTTVAGAGESGYRGDGGSALEAQLASPRQLTCDGQGNLYIADSGNHRVRKITPDGVITTVAGNGTRGTAGDGGPATEAQLDSPRGLAFDGVGNLYISDSRRVAKVTPSTIISTRVEYVPSGGFGSLVSDAEGNLHLADGQRVYFAKAGWSSAYFSFGGAGDLLSPRQIAADGRGNLYVARGFEGILKITPDGLMQDYLSGRAVWATSLALDASGDLYVSDSSRNQVHKITAGGAGSTVAGDGTRGFGGDNGPALAAQLASPGALAVDSAGNLYIADSGNSRIRKVTAGGVISTVAGNGTPGFSGDGGPATSAQIEWPGALAVDSAGNLYIAGGNRIRKVSPSGQIATVGGNGLYGASRDGITATSALLYPFGLVVDRAGNLYFSDSFASHRIRVLTPSCALRTVAGAGMPGFSGDGGVATEARLYTPLGLASDGAGNIYVSDFGNHRIRKLTPNPPTQLRIASGSNQTGPAGECLATPLTVKVAGASGVGVPGIDVSFAVTTGSATLTRNSARTSNDGTARAEVSLGSAPGNIIVTASAAGLQAVAFNLTAGPASGSGAAPCVTEGAVVGSAFSLPPWKQLSPNGLVTLFGQNLAPAGVSRAVSAADIVNRKLPTLLEGICVEAGGSPAPVLFVNSRQINFQAPSLAATGRAAVRVIRNCGTTNATRSNEESVSLQAASPELFVFALNAEGGNPVIAQNAVTGELIAEPGMLPSVTFVPAKPGDIISVFGTGFGLTDPAVPAGELAGGAAPLAGKVKVLLAGWELNSEDVLYAGTAPGFAGLYQINFRIPAVGLQGDLLITVRVGSLTSPLGPSLHVVR